MERKIFISSDIEGTCGIAHWDETSKDKGDYGAFAMQMSKEVAAACQGAFAGGANDVLVKDAHDSARNIHPHMLPIEAKIFRGWGSQPFSMMAGISQEFDGVFFTGYHSAAYMNGNPLSHTMNLRNNYVKINGVYAAELMINSLTAAMLQVPIRMVTGDKMLCDWMNSVCPGTLTVPVNEGIGSGCIAIHPELAVKRIRETAQQAMELDAADCMFPMPKHFTVEVNYKEHQNARRNSFYPGASQKDAKTILFEADDFMDVLCFFQFCL